MKTQIANSTKNTSTNRLTWIASIAALLLLMCFASSAWAQSPVTVYNQAGNPVPVYIEQAGGDNLCRYPSPPPRTRP